MLQNKEGKIIIYYYFHIFGEVDENIAIHGSFNIGLFGAFGGTYKIGVTLVGIKLLYRQIHTDVPQ